MKEFWDCLWIGQPFLIAIGAVVALTFIGQIWTQLSGRFDWTFSVGYWYPGQGAVKYWAESFNSGVAMAISSFIIYALYDIIRCAICPECGL